MASYFTLQLDTTPPLVEIYAPPYTLVGINNEVEVVANEELSPYQEIYIIDNLGVRHDLIFHHEADRFIGIINLDGYPEGSAEIYAVVKDTVFNKSNVIRKSIEIISQINALRMEINIDDLSRDIKVTDTLRQMIVGNVSMGIAVDDLVASVETANLSTGIEVSDEDKYQVLITDIAT